MFGLVLVLLGIGLAAVAGIASMYYLGSSAKEARAQAAGAALSNQAAQITSATQVYMADHGGVKPGTLEDLVNQNYLKSVPEGWVISTSSPETATAKYIEDETVCRVFNKQQGIDGIPSCIDLGDVTGMVCCQ